uniref:Uncharacterized protein n=1 Tax=Arundo donax TaxID=35708 RepID=A0A0A8ZLS8_ARUDO
MTQHLQVSSFDWSKSINRPHTRPIKDPHLIVKEFATDEIMFYPHD